MPRSRRLGAGAEDSAAEFLRSLGYTIVTRNFVAPGLSEIDIVAMDGDVCVFVEVKERRTGGLVGPEESVSLSKQRRLWEAASYYLGIVVE
jgi:putative endonuclease